MGFEIDAARFVCYLKDTFVGRSIEDWESLGGGVLRKPGILKLVRIVTNNWTDDPDKVWPGLGRLR